GHAAGVKVRGCQAPLSTPIPARWGEVAARQRWAADLSIPGETCMRTARFLLTVVIVLLYTSHVAAQTEARSDGTLIEQTPCTPQDTAGKQFPLIIYSRGGNREFGKLTAWSRLGFYTYVSNGFVVLASQYRGNDGGEGREEYGGADVRDVLNLIPLARSLGYV